ncbi:hypothetical protein [Bosea sp. UC22_33]|uniref:hypothetical protein n=1 Tax=Bosea sp. UC22_33 TaxID=3350165 RepID=UPI0036722F42
MTIALTLHRTYDDHPRPEDNDKFWSIHCDGYYVGSLVLHQGRSDQPPDWRWNFHMHPGRYGNGARLTDSGAAPTRDAALPDIRKALERYLEFIGPEGWATHVNQMEWLKERKEATRKRENRE